MAKAQNPRIRAVRCDKNSPLDEVHCKECNFVYPRYQLSKAGLCVNCGYNRVLASITQMKTKRGPLYEKWLARTQGTKTEMKGGNHGQEND